MRACLGVQILTSDLLAFFSPPVGSSISLCTLTRGVAGWGERERVSECVCMCVYLQGGGKIARPIKDFS